MHASAQTHPRRMLPDPARVAPVCLIPPHSFTAHPPHTPHARHPHRPTPPHKLPCSSASSLGACPCLLALLLCVGAAPPWLGRQDRLGGCVGSRHGGTGSLGFGGRGRPRAQDRAARGHNHPSTPFDAGVCGGAWGVVGLCVWWDRALGLRRVSWVGVPCRRGSGIRGPMDGLDGRQGRGLD